jgi:hypothetical protein
MKTVGTMCVLTLALTGCAGSAPSDASAPPGPGGVEATSAVADDAGAPSSGGDAPNAPDAGAASVGKFDDAGVGELPTVERSSTSGDPKTEQDAQLAAAVHLKSGHKECLTAARAKKPGWKPTHYEIVLTLAADGAIRKVSVDKAKTDVSDPAFMPCITKRLQGGTYPPPGREVTARLIYPD